MKRFFLLALTAVFIAGPLAAADAKPSKRDQLVTRVENCEAILQGFMARRDTAIPAEVLRRARAIVIVNQFKAGFLFGLKEGYGVLMTKKPNGRWSLPVLISAGEASLGFQIGATAVETVYIITDDSTTRLFFNKSFNIGVDAKAVAGPRAAEVENTNKPIVDAPVLVYTKSSGLYAGATVKAGYLSRDDDANRILYNTEYTMPELLYGDWVTPPAEVRPLMDFVQKIAP